MGSNDTYPGLVHRIAARSNAGHSKAAIVTFEHKPDPQQNDVTNTIIFLGGLSDGLLTVPFVPPLVSALPTSWSLVEPTLSSACRQWGYSTLGEDIAEIGRVVEYFRKLRPHGKVALMGHSTGSQQIMHYLLSETKLPPIDGGIFQASASDREAITTIMDESDYDSTCKTAQSYVDKGHGDDILPFSATETIFLTSPVSARRWLSLASPGPGHLGEDDYFSSDLDDARLERTFGRLGKTGTRLMFLFSGEDQYVPDTVDKENLVARWHEHIKQGGGIIDDGSGIVEEASHTIPEGGDGLEDLVKRVTGFLNTCESSSRI